MLVLRFNEFLYHLQNELRYVVLANLLAYIQNTIV
jgi:hypothetical protein